MSEWWTYTLSDFLLFSPRVYYRLFELHNRALWPAQFATIVLGFAILAAAIYPSRFRERAAFGVLGALWIWVAWSFFWERYASINWAAAYVTPAFALQGFALIALALTGRIAFSPRQGLAWDAGALLLAVALVGYPFLAVGNNLSFARDGADIWRAAEVFGIAPDPTAVATLATLALANASARWLLFLVPAAWCLVTSATLWALDAPGFFVPLVGAIIAIGVARLRS